MGKRGPRITTSPCPLCSQKPVRWGDAGWCGCRQYKVVEGELEVVVRRGYKRRRQQVMIAEVEEVGQVDGGMTAEEYETLNGWEPVEEL